MKMSTKRPTPRYIIIKMAKRLKTKNFLKGFYLFIFRERGRDGEREKHQCVVVSCVHPPEDLAQNPGMCPN